MQGTKNLRTHLTYVGTIEFVKYCSLKFARVIVARLHTSTASLICTHKAIPEAIQWHT